MTIDTAEYPEYLLAQGDAARLPLPDKSCDLVIGSPPYVDCRLYLEDGRDLGISRDCREWVDWMLNVTAEAVRVSRGLVLWVCAGVTRDHCYWPACEGLLWEHWKAGGQCWRPAFWYRVGIPGSGGKKWLRADVEYVLCFKGEGNDFWTDNTACGKPPVYAPGGALSHRVKDGTRRNHWGFVDSASGSRKRNGERDRHEAKPVGYDAPVIANPGNLIKTTLELIDLTDIMDRYGKSTKTDPREVLRGLRDAVDSQEVGLWFRGIYTSVLGQEILRLGVQRKGVAQDPAGSPVRDVRPPADPEAIPDGRRRELHGDGQEAVLLSRMSGEGGGKAGRSPARGIATPGQEDRTQEEATGGLRGMRDDGSPAGPPRERGRDRQHPEQSESPLPEVSSEGACESGWLSGVWGAASSLGLLRQALPEIQEVWRSFGEASQSAFGRGEVSGLISIPVGGGQLGSPFAHLSDAPYPEALVEFFVRSFCPPGGMVVDPFSGSGTTVAVSLKNGRRAVGFDLRRSQADLGTRRIADSLRPVSRLDVAVRPVKPLAGQLEMF